MHPGFPMGMPPPHMMSHGMAGMMPPGFPMGMPLPHMMPGMMPPMFAPPMSSLAPPSLSVPAGGSAGSVVAAAAAPTVGASALAQTSMHPTSYALNKHIFTNAQAGLPLSLFIGQ
ncbi:hypothetical protein EON64_09160 [archaeon]|nr:MAG: hypothetical protein EON64_09160 [archaeon]